MCMSDIPSMKIILITASTYLYAKSHHCSCFNQHFKSSQVCREWEATALRVNKDVRLALIRIGVVLGKDGGALGMTNHYGLYCKSSFYAHGLLIMTSNFSFLPFKLSN
jgi:NAD dependent epimerase/dehydratase family enzyme